MKTPEEFGNDLKAVLGANLRAAAVYGSSAAGDRTRKYSDVNVIIVLERVDTAVLASMAPMVAKWMRAGNRAPAVTVENQLRRSQDVFPIELADIRERHRLLHGDPAILNAIEIKPAHLRRQLEFELRSKVFLLRQAFLESAGRGGVLEETMARSMSSVAALFRAILRLSGGRPPSSTPEVLRAVAQIISVDLEAWQAVWRLRQGERLPQGLQAPQLFDRLLAGLQNAVDFVDAHPASN